MCTKQNNKFTTKVEHVSGMIDVNSIRVDRNGHGVYVKTAIMSHRLSCQDKVDLRLKKIIIFSCISNTKTIWNEDETVDVRAVLPIKRGTEITKNYVNRWQYCFGKLLPPVSLLLG